MALHSKSGRKSADRLGENPRHRQCNSNSSQSRHSTAHRKPKGRGGSASGLQIQARRAVSEIQRRLRHERRTAKRPPHLREAATVSPEVRGPDGAAPLPIETKGAAAPRREEPPFSMVGMARRRRPTPRGGLPRRSREAHRLERALHLREAHLALCDSFEISPT
jgi:hypothetical protein